MKWHKQGYKTARCVLRCDDEILLAVHSSFWNRPNRRWGLPGGNIEWRETPLQAVQRELAEELELRLTDFVEIGAYSYKGRQHLVFGADTDTRVSQFDEQELLDIGWYSRDAVTRLSQENRLHAGYEKQVIDEYLHMVPVSTQKTFK